MKISKTSGGTGNRYEARCSVGHFKPDYHRSAYSVQFFVVSGSNRFLLATFIRLAEGPSELILANFYDRVAVGFAAGQFDVPVLTLVYDAVRYPDVYDMICQLNDDSNDYPEWSFATSNTGKG